MAARFRWVTERPYFLLIMAPIFLLLGTSWAYFAHALNAIEETSVHAQSGSAALSDDVSTTLAWRLFVAHPWISLCAGLIWGAGLGLWDRRRTTKFMELRVDALRREARGHRFAMFTRLPGEFVFWGFFSLALALIYLVPLAAKPFLFAGAASNFVVLFPTERVVYRRLESALAADPMDDQTRARADKWLRSQKAAPLLAGALLVLSVAICIPFLKLSNEVSAVFSQAATRIAEAHSQPSDTNPDDR